MATTLTDKERGEIALKVLKYKMKKDGITLSKEAGRSLANSAKVLDVELEKLKEFSREIYQELFDEVFK